MELNVIQNANSAKIERAAVRALESIVDSHSELSAQISKNDRYPIWDGDIFVYSSHLHKNDSIKGRIPVQVKGRKVKNQQFSQETTFYSLSINHLKTYCNDGGVIFFVVEVNDTEVSKIFYKTLLPVDIKDILQKSKSSKSIKTQFDELIDTKHKNLKLICNDFLIHRNRQCSYQSNINPTEIETIKGGSLFLPTTDLHYLLHNETFIYFGPADFPPLLIEKGQVTSVAGDYECDVSVSKPYFSKMKVEESKNGRKIFFGSKIELDFGNEEQRQQQNLTAHMRLEGPLNEVITTIDFFIDILDEKQFSINDACISLNNFTGQKDGLMNLSRELKTIMKLFVTLRLPIDIDLEKIYAQKNFLLALSNPILERKTSEQTILKKTDDGTVVAGSYCVDICGFLCYFIEMGSAQNGYMIYDYFSYDFTDICKFSIALKERLDGSEDRLEAPFLAYSKFEYKDLKRIASEPNNFSRDAVIKAIEKSHPQLELSGTLINFLLNILAIYDENPNEDFYIIADALSLKLMCIEGSTINKLNRMQVIKRKRNLNSCGADELSHLIESTQAPDLLCAIHILLENNYEVRKYLNTMSPDMKETFTSYPMYNLWNKTIRE
ncbi:hypothetical protein C4J81_01875 [Deltaproteobacteria bacterium Smac51]|nr:hypothetical protein C4J81_01875 [Deltaproteobacteria bacterium Smac51]